VPRAAVVYPVTWGSVNRRSLVILGLALGFAAGASAQTTGQHTRRFLEHAHAAIGVLTGHSFVTAHEDLGFVCSAMPDGGVNCAVRGLSFAGLFGPKDRLFHTSRHTFDADPNCAGQRRYLDAVYGNGADSSYRAAKLRKYKLTLNRTVTFVSFADGSCSLGMGASSMIR